MASLDKLRDKLIIEFLPDDQYYHEVYKKTQHVLHHTVSGRGVKGDINWWKIDPLRIATAFIYDYYGKIYQLFNYNEWGHHLGVKVIVFKANGVPYTYAVNSKGKGYVSNNEVLNQHSIGHEIDSWGPLMIKNGRWYPVRKVNNRYIPNVGIKNIPIEDIQFYSKKYRGFNAYDKYSYEQIRAVEEVILALNGEFEIPLSYKEDMWDLSIKALSGEPGIWNHTSYRRDKFDCHPQPELIQMLKSLETPNFIKSTIFGHGTVNINP